MICNHTGCKVDEPTAEFMVMHHLRDHGSVRGPDLQRYATHTFLSTRPQVTAAEVAETLGFSIDRARDLLNDLASKDHVEVVEGSRPRAWRASA